MRLFVTLLITLLLIRCGGTTDETLSSQGTVYNNDGSRAASVEISVFESTEDVKPVYTTVTNMQGGYDIDTMLSGKYNIWAKKGSLVGCNQSVVLKNMSSPIPNDTIREPKFISGIVKMQPNHDPRTVIVHVLGSELHNSNVQKDGRFVINNLAIGEFRLQFSTSEKYYTTTFKSFTAKSDTLFVDTVTLVFTGIPVVTGFTTRYDTLSGSVYLSWNKTEYHNFQEYVIYCNDDDLPFDPPRAIAATTDTFWADTNLWFFYNYDANGWDFGDAEPVYKNRYRVSIKNSANDSAPLTNYQSLIAVRPPSMTTFTHTIQRLSSVNDTSGQTNDSFRIIVSAKNPSHVLFRSAWLDPESGNELRNTVFKDSTIVRRDTLLYCKTTPGEKKLLYSVTDDYGKVYPDTIAIIADSTK